MSLVSIIIPSYNHSKFLEERLISIENQTFTDWELIIIDDCSTDNSLELLDKFAKKNKEKVKHFIKNKKNSGSGYCSWKKGIELSNSKYIWIAETDDYSEPTFLEEQVRVLEQSKAVLSFCTSKYVDAKGNYLYNSSNRTKDLNVHKEESKVFESYIFIQRMPFKPYITNGSSVVFKKPNSRIPDEIFAHKQSSDSFFWTYLVRGSNFIFLNKELNFFRRHGNSTTKKNKTSNQLNGYKEKLLFIRFFNLPYKEFEFLNHYFNHYVLNYKQEIFKIKFFDSNQLRIKYFYVVLINLYKKIKINLWKRSS